jgi:hypothetical protein
MPNAIKYNTSTETLALKKGNFWIGKGDVSKGPTSSTGYYNGITPPSGGYTIYLNKVSGGPSIYVASNDSQLISLTNIIAGTSYTTVSQCIQYYSIQTDKFILNRDFSATFPYITTDALTCYLDAGITDSYPETGNDWYDISGNGVRVTKQTGQATAASWNSNGYWVMNNTSDPRTSSANGFGFNGYIPISGTKSFSFEAWIRFNSLPGQTSIINNAGSCPGYRWGVDGSNMYWLIGPGSGCVGYSEGGLGGGISTNVWLQLVGVFDKQNELGAGNKFYSYVNGSVTGDVGISPNIDMYNGAANISNGSCCQSVNGDIAIIRIYNKALSSSEISTNWNAQKSRFGL